MNIEWALVQFHALSSSRIECPRYHYPYLSQNTNWVQLLDINPKPVFIMLTDEHQPKRNRQLKLSISCNLLLVSDEKNRPLAMDGVEGASCHETTSLRNHITKACLCLPRDNQLFISSLGLGLSLFCIHRCSYLEPLATAIKFSYGGLKGMKSIQQLHSLPDAIVFAIEALMKGYKVVSKRISLPQTSSGSSGFGAKRLKSYVGILNLIRYVRSMKSLTPEEIGFLGFLSIIYKLTKNSLKTAECFVGVESGALLKRELEAIGLIVKTGYLTSELSRTRKVVVDEEGGKCAFLSARCTSNIRLCGDFFCLHIRKTDYDVSYGRLLDRHQILSLNYGVVKDAKVVESCISDILCLSIPVDQEIRTNHCYSEFT